MKFLEEQEKVREIKLKDRGLIEKTFEDELKERKHCI